MNPRAPNPENEKGWTARRDAERAQEWEARLQRSQNFREHRECLWGDHSETTLASAPRPAEEGGRRLARTQFDRRRSCSDHRKHAQSLYKNNEDDGSQNASDGPVLGSSSKKTTLTLDCSKSVVVTETYFPVYITWPKNLPNRVAISNSSSHATTAASTRPACPYPGPSSWIYRCVEGKHGSGPRLL